MPWQMANDLDILDWGLQIFKNLLGEILPKYIEVFLGPCRKSTIKHFWDIWWVRNVSFLHKIRKWLEKCGVLNTL